MDYYDEPDSPDVSIDPYPYVMPLPDRRQQILYTASNLFRESKDVPVEDLVAAAKRLAEYIDNGQ